jgi:hypothetical protein
MPNNVTLTFDGNTAPAEQAFDRVGGSASHMSDKVGESASGFSKAGEAADGAEGKAQGFSDTLTGVADVGGGTAAIMKGNLFEGFVQVGQGAADLAGGLASFLIPALEKTRVGTLAKAAADKVAAAGAKVWAGAQWLMNSALLASPVTWIIVGIVALIAIIVLIATKTDWFQRAWRAAWGWIKSSASNAWEFIKKIPGWISTAFSKIGSFVSAPFKAGFNAIARAWNNTVGRLSWSVPGWVPFIGGNSISVPRLPTFHSGVGRVPGVVGTTVMAQLQAGEEVRSIASAGGGSSITLRSDGSAFADLIIDTVAGAVRRAGGDPAVINLKIA